jgi:hypothetical protein
MATNTYVALQTQTLASAASSVTFNSIPQDYTDLVLVISGIGDSNGYLLIQPNSDSSSLYSRTYMIGNGSSATSARQTNESAYFVDAGNGSSSTPANTVVSILNYSNTTTYKTALVRAYSYLAPGPYAGVGLYRSTSAITSLKIQGSSGSSLQSGSTFSLYGVAASDNSYTAKATGGTITADVGYIYHTFTSSGTFTPLVPLTADVLVVAGGGGGGNYFGAGGGGAGGVLGFASQSLSSAQTVTIGAGGAGSNGSNSQFASLTAAVGGGRGGGLYTTNTGNSGGSGGGGSEDTSNTYVNGGAGTSGQGNAGGRGYFYGGGNKYNGGGGGGYASAGSDGAYASAGNGGTGTNSVTNLGSIVGLLTTTNLGVSGLIAGGGGGSPYAGSSAGSGSGGGGNGGVNTANGGVGTDNTGGGGGGGNNNGAPSGGSFPNTGGSGVVVVRYAK